MEVSAVIIIIRFFSVGLDLGGWLACSQLSAKDCVLTAVPTKMCNSAAL